MNNIIFFDEKIKAINEETKSKLGIRGRRCIELANAKLPIAPGFIIDSELTPKLSDLDIRRNLEDEIKKIEKAVGKKFGDPKNPLFLKIVLSSDFQIPFFPSIHNLGITSETVDGFAALSTPEFAYGEYLFFLKNFGIKVLNIEATEFESADNSLKKKNKNVDDLKVLLEKYKEILGDYYFDDPYEQLVIALQKAAERYCDSEIDVDNSLAIIVQAMVYGNLGENSYAGSYFTRDIVEGKKELQGCFFHNEFDLGKDSNKTKDINKIDSKYLKVFTEIADKIEKLFKDIREVKFTIENDRIWVIEQREITDKSSQSIIKTLLSLNEQKIITDNELISTIKVSQINELLHPVIDKKTLKGISKIQGGISGATGAAIGRAYFSTEALLDEYRRATRAGEDNRLILVMPATYAEDVKAIEVAQGVISTEGGFSSHAPVVSRSLGKVAMVQPDMQIRSNFFTLGGEKIKEGDYVSLNVPYYEEPTLYFGKTGLLEPNFEKNGLLDVIEKSDKFVKDFDVMANADQKRDAELAMSFKANGIGLCRTEHMFFDEKRIMVFREMILANSSEKRKKILAKLSAMQRSDFYDLFKTAKNKKVTIRLLDAPLHEFLPKNDAGMKDFIAYMQKMDKTIKPADIKNRCADLAEVNPMLGHRGCRIAVTYPEIYEMQCRAIFEAACMCKKEGIKVMPKIMIPIVLGENEVKFIKTGKKIEGSEVKGLNDVKDEVLSEYGIKNFEYSIGSMIELPAAALGAGKIAQYAEFFSFGTNDLTQTTYGLSRDDINSFLPSYSKYDLMKDNPFKILGDEVKELIETATLRGRLTRPDLDLGLCGEQGADPENIAFCMNAGLNYVSTSPYSIPIAKLAIAQIEIAKDNSL